MSACGVKSGLNLYRALEVTLLIHTPSSMAAGNDGMKSMGRSTTRAQDLTGLNKLDFVPPARSWWWCSNQGFKS
jgi:hypothetical protein